MSDPEGVLRRAGYREPPQVVRDKEIDRIDRHCRAFIEISPWATLATADADGFPDVSPRGGEPGFVKVLDEQRLALPERWPGRGDFPPIGRVFRDHCDLPAPLPPDEVMRADMLHQL